MKKVQYELAPRGDTILSLLDEVLFLTGWEHDGTGWIAPEAWQESIQKIHGGGMHWNRESAIRFTIRCYEEMSNQEGAGWMK